MIAFPKFSRLAAAAFLATLWSVPILGADDDAATSAGSQAQTAREKQECSKNLRQIYQAIQAYRKDHKQLPHWLSDLTPQYLSDPSVFICPVTKRTGAEIPFKQLADPKIKCSYAYEFCDAEMGNDIWGGGKMKMRDFKAAEMSVIGGDTPILRCLLHDPKLNIGFDGKFFESPTTWETLYQDVVDMNDLSPATFMARFAQGSAENGGRPSAALEEPQEEFKALVDKPAPDFTLDLMGGGEFKLADEQQKHTVILDFWATWCGPCRSALPVLTEVSEQYRDKGVILRGVDLREKPEVISDYLKNSHLNLTVLLDKDGKVAELFKVKGIPQTVIIGKDGAVRRVHVGYSPDLKQRLTGDLDAVLAGKPLVVDK